jgi:class 3 adenylate cyclase/tetratricopeptide (TPR) repeat protein
MSILIDTLASYVPNLVARHYSTEEHLQPLPTSSQVEAALLFVDISGFTALTEQLGRKGPVGAEQLSGILNTTFSQILDLIAMHGGDVVKFAGDALLAVWIADESDTLATSTLRATQCAVGINARLERFYSLVSTVRLSLRLVIAVGEVAIVHLGGIQSRREVLLVGDPINEFGVYEEHSILGEVVLAPSAWPHIQDRCELTFIAPEQTEPLAQLVTIHKPIENRPLTRASLDSEAATYLRTYIPGAVMSRLLKEQNDWLAELRRLSVLFIKLPDLYNHDGVLLSLAQTIMEEAQNALYRYEGSVNKLSIDNKGAMLVAAFGLPPFAHEDDPLRAVQAALALQTALASYNIQCAIGITTGRAFCGEIGSNDRREYTMIGDIVNLAARLMQAASADSSILCDAATYTAVQSTARSRLSFDQPIIIPVKGKSQPIPVYRVREGHEQAPSQSFPELEEAVLVGRARERAKLNELIYATLSEGIGGVVMIEGEAGMGKSRLVHYASQMALNNGLTVVTGSADAVDQSTPYHTWRAIFTQLLGSDAQLSDDQRKQVLYDLLSDTPGLRARLPLLNAVLSFDFEETSTTASLTGQARTSATLEFLLIMVQRLLAEKAHLIIIEDAHWLDPSSWAFALTAAQNIHSLGLIITMRPLGWRHPPEYEQLRSLARSYIELNALSPSETLELICRRLGVNSVPQAVADLIGEKAQGNPFFSEELAYALRDTGFIRVSNGQCSLVEDTNLNELSFPETVQGAIISRVDRLSVTQQLTLKVASVIGRVFTRTAVHAIYPTSIGLNTLSEDLSTLAQLNITPVEALEPDPTYSFKHAITQDVVYNMMLFSQRRRLHRAVAEWYEQSNPEKPNWLWPLLAHHWTQAEDVKQAINALEHAGALAMQVSSFLEARALFEQAITLLLNTNDNELSNRRVVMMQFLLNLGEARQYLGDFSGAQVAYNESHDLAQQLDHSDGQIAGLSRLGRIAIEMGDYPNALTYLEQGLDLARQHKDETAIAFILSNLANLQFRQSNYPQAYSLYQESLGIQMRLRDFEGVALSLNGLGNATLNQGLYDEADYFYHESLNLRREQNDRWGEAVTLNNLGRLAHQRNDYTEARAFYDQALEIYQSLGDQRGMAMALSNIGFTLLARNELASAELSFDKALRISMRIGVIPLTLEVLIGIASLYVRYGKFQQAAEIIGSAINHSASHVEVHFQSQRVLEELQPRLKPEQLMTALARGRNRSLNETLDLIQAVST